MSLVRVYIESEKNSPLPTEHSFMRYILKKFCNWSAQDFEENLIGVGGYRNLIHSNKLEETAKEGGINLVIFDADRKDNGGGFEKRQDELKKMLEKMEAKAEIFLWPNNSDDGELEDLLLRLIPEEKRTFIDCFEQYQKCIEDNGGTPLDLKTKVHSYVACVSKKKEREKEKKDSNTKYLFDKEEYWDMSNPALEQIKGFLTSKAKKDTAESSSPAKPR